MAAPQSINRDAFLHNVRQSGLLSEAELSAALPRLPATSRGRVIARSLVEMGVLTRFQAERLLAGRTSGFVLGQYRLLEQVGRGGMGRVYRAEHVTMKRVVALKVLAATVLQTDRARELFLREVRVAAQLSHPNIVTAYDASDADGRFYLVLEYIDGPNLERLVRERGPLEVGLACDYVCQTAGGLQCAHQMGLVHRDLKPANLLVQRRGFDEATPGLIKISDFGLARLQVPPIDPSGSHVVGTILTRENTVMGTPDYLSPEQARNLHACDTRSDIYSLGCTLYYLLTGRVPFPGGKAIDKLIRHNAEQPAPVTHFRSDVPPSVLGVLDRMTAKRPADRYQTMAELADALKPFAVSGPIPWAPMNTPAQSLTDTPLEAGSAAADSADDLTALDFSDAGEPTASMIRRSRGGNKSGRRLLPWLVAGAAGVLALVAAGLVMLFAGR